MITLRFLPYGPALLLWAIAACGADLALVHAKIYPSPEPPAIERGTVIVREGRILAVGPDASLKVPPGTSVIDASGLTVTAGFWNSHVHLLTPGLLHADKLPDSTIQTQIEAMLTRWGFTTVFDIGSLLDNTAAIRRRVSGGGVKGPRILTTGEPFWAKGGTPVYVKGFLEEHHIEISEIGSIRQAEERVRRQIEGGADGIKIFTGSILRDGVLIMPGDLAAAIVARAHRAGKPVFAHPSNDAGIEAALTSGADILAHTAPNGGPWNPALAARLKKAGLALIPSLTLWDVEGTQMGWKKADIEKWMDRAVQQLHSYSSEGGEILFGTDVGYIEQADTSEEFALMARAGMNFRQILASLTSNPARRFGESAVRGRVEKGMAADLAVLEADPAAGPSAFAKVRYTIRDGNLIYAAK